MDDTPEGLSFCSAIVTFNRVFNEDSKALSVCELHNNELRNDQLYEEQKAWDWKVLV